MDIKIRKDHILITPNNERLIIEQVGNVIKISIAKKDSAQKND